MSFSADWLALREPADHAARDPILLRRAAEFAIAAAGGGAPVIVDLGCGTGSTARAMAPFLPNGAEWRLVDNDRRLLDLAVSRTGPRARAFPADLADIPALPLDGAHLVTASALFDLVPADWVAALAPRLSGAGIGIYAALSYDGVMAWAPALPADAAVTAAFNRHQRSDKGLGRALGPDAGPEAAAILARAGLGVSQAASPWVLGPGQAALQAELCAGIAAAAAEAGCPEAPDWGRQRAATSARTRCTIGHLDLLALPPDPRAKT